MLSKYTLLITGCIQPNSSVPILAVKNAEDRKRQYVESVDFYLRTTKVLNVVYCDNSSSVLPEELSEMAKQHNKAFECLSFSGDAKKTVEQGKGYGEGEIIEYALRNSELLRHSNYLVKVTGRVKVKNIDFILRYMKNDKMYFHRNSQRNIDTKFYGMPINVYEKYFLNLYQQVNDTQNVYIENLFSDKVRCEDLKINRFVVFPNAQGISGSTGLPYTTPLIGRIKQTIKSYLWV